MKYLLSILFILCIQLSGIGQDASPLTFVVEQVDLGSIEKGDKVKGAFEYSNTSQQSVFIDLVSTCECTEAHWTDSEIKPGETGSIDFVFDSSKKEEEELIDVDVILRNMDSKGNPFFHYLSYTYTYD